MTPDEIKAHIWSKCHECGDCLLWDGAVNDAGVPQMRLPGTREVFSVRRLLLTAMGQDIAGKIASTRCGNQLCMAEKHVTPMTRQQLQKRSGKKLVGNLARAAKLAATRRKTAKLTMEQAQEMRQLRAEGVTTYEAAERYGISQGAAARVMRGDSWRDYSSPYTQLMTRRQA